MRFTTAIALVTTTGVPTARSIFDWERVVDEGLVDRQRKTLADFFKDPKKNTVGRHRRLQSQLNGHDKLAIYAYRKRSGLLRNPEKIQASQQRECDPTKFDPDLGILSCGSGQYCISNKYSTLGGVCMDVYSDSSHVTGRRRVQDESGSNETETETGSNETETETLFDYGYSLCNSDGNCTCTDINETEYRGNVYCTIDNEQCYTTPSDCGVNHTGCFVYNISSSLKGVGEYDNSLCVLNTEPYYQKICYYTSSKNFTLQSCEMSFNGVKCNSCEVSRESIEYCSESGECTDETFYCYLFDCTNTDGGHEGSDCFGNGDLIASVYRYSYGCVEDCNICGSGGVLTLPNSTFEISTYFAEEFTSAAKCMPWARAGISLQQNARELHL